MDKRTSDGNGDFVFLREIAVDVTTMSAGERDNICRGEIAIGTVIVLGHVSSEKKNVRVHTVKIYTRKLAVTIGRIRQSV